MALGSVSVAGARRTCDLGAGLHILLDQELLGQSRDAASSLPVPPQRWPCCTQRTASEALRRGFQGCWAHTETPTTRPCARGRPGACRTFRTGPRCFSLIFDKITDKTVQNSVQRSQFKPCLPWLSSDWPKQKSLWGSSRQPLPSLTPLRVLTSPHFPSCTPIPAQPRIRPSPPLLPALCPW